MVQIVSSHKSACLQHAEPELQKDEGETNVAGENNSNCYSPLLVIPISFEHHLVKVPEYSETSPTAPNLM